jgi:hypothetical protein
MIVTSICYNSRMAKKKQGKKHKFKYSDASMPAPGAVPAFASAGEVKAPQLRHSGNSATRDFSYVAVDLRRILILAAFLVLVEITLYYLINHTGLGGSLDSLVKI